MIAEYIDWQSDCNIINFSERNWFEKDKLLPRDQSKLTEIQHQMLNVWNISFVWKQMLNLWNQDDQVSIANLSW